MMKGKCKLRRSFFFSAFLLSFSVFSAAAAELPEWTVAAEKFTWTGARKPDPVREAVASMLPSEILGRLGTASVRSVMLDEELERKLYELRNERVSLLLQFSSAVRKRDAAVLGDSSPGVLRTEISEAEKSAAEIRKKIDANIAAQKQAESDAARKAASSGHASFLRGFFLSEDTAVQTERIALYKGDASVLYTPPSGSGHLDREYEKAAVSSGIRGVIAGKITSYGDYVSATAELYLYPGARLAGSAVEVGSSGEYDFIASGLARQLAPMLSNSIPSVMRISVSPEEIRSRVSMYLDDVFYAAVPDEISVASGVHQIQFRADGYETAGTSLFLAGNEAYSVSVTMRELSDGILRLGVRGNPAGTVYSGVVPVGIIGENSPPAVIAVNGKPVLGEFIDSTGEGAFYYIPRKLAAGGNVLEVNARAFDRSSYIEKRRRWMYAAYSSLVTSLVPSFAAYGLYTNFAAQASVTGDMAPAERLRYASVAAAAVSVGCGLFFGYELGRYFVAANSVLPATARPSGRPELYGDFPAVSPDSSADDVAAADSGK